jgi:uncharacterized protein (DUF983 family)
MTDRPVTDWGGQPAIAQAALFGLCPSCGARSLFAGWLRLAPACHRCGLSFAAANVGDGPAALLMLPLGALVVAGALFAHFAWGLVWWAQVLLWVPVTTGLTIFGLRLIKGWLFAAEYQRGAHEGRRVE